MATPACPLVTALTRGRTGFSSFGQIFSGRLAVNDSAQGQGVGKMLPADAIIHTLTVSDQIAIYAGVVGAIDGIAKGFCEQFGFIRLSDDGPRLFLPLKSII